MEKDTQDQGSPLAFIVGLLAGAAAGVLLAPYANKENLNRLAEEAKSIKDQLDNGLADAGLLKVKGKKKKNKADTDDLLQGGGKKKKDKKKKKKDQNNNL